MSLPDLPPELTERIVVLLPLPDISSLRLTNKCLASKTAQKHLKASFRTKRVELTEQRLRSFVAITAYDGLGCLLKNLTLVAPVYSTLELTAQLEERTARVVTVRGYGENLTVGRCVSKNLTEEEVRRAERDLVVLQERQAEYANVQHRQRNLELLSQAFCNLAAHGASLRMLRTEVEIYKDDTTTPLLPLFGGNWKPIWASAADASHTMFAALATCDLPVQTLDLFNCSRMARCSLSLEKLDGVEFSSDRLPSSLGHLEELSMSISFGVLVRSSDGLSSAEGSSDEASSEEGNSGEEVAHEESPEKGTLEVSTQSLNFDGLRSLLRTCPNIQKLDLAHFMMRYGDAGNSQCGLILQALGGSSLPRLRDLTLQGFAVTENELLALLQGFGTLRNLSLTYIRLTDGSFRRTLDYCTLEAAMDKLELDGLIEHKMVQFEDPWAVCPGESDRLSGWYPLSRASYRRAPDTFTNHQIQYHFHPRTFSSGSINRWYQDKQNRFGPLEENGKQSCLQPHVRPEQTWRYR